VNLLGQLDRQRQTLERSATLQTYDEHRQAAISLLADPRVRRAFDVTNAKPHIQQRYGRNSYGWALLMAFPPVEAGRNMTQDNPQTPENMAATIYHALGIPAEAVWRDTLDRPHHIYYSRPIPGLI